MQLIQGTLIVLGLSTAAMAIVRDGTCGQHMGRPECRGNYKVDGKRHQFGYVCNSGTCENLKGAKCSVTFDDNGKKQTSTCPSDVAEGECKDNKCEGTHNGLKFSKDCSHNAGSCHNENGKPCNTRFTTGLTLCPGAH